MTSETNDENAPASSPDDAFAILGNETRMEILQALWEAYEPYEGETAIRFSELYERVGTADSGQFNYHLEKLTDHFVRQSEDGYELTGAGFHVVRVVIAGSVGEQPAIGPAVLSVDCPHCGGRLETVYENHKLEARCTECVGTWETEDGAGGFVFRLEFPPAGLAARTPEEVFHATVTYTHHQIASLLSGVCPYCAGVVDESLDVCEAHDPGEDGSCPNCDRHHLVEVSTICRRCKAAERGPLTIAILSHPTVTAFYHEHGIEHRFESWETHRRGQTLEEELVGTDPLRVRITVPCEDDRLQLTLDETLTVVDATR